MRKARVMVQQALYHMTMMMPTILFGTLLSDLHLCLSLRKYMPSSQYLSEMTCSYSCPLVSYPVSVMRPHPLIKSMTCSSQKHVFAHRCGLIKHMHVQCAPALFPPPLRAWVYTRLSSNCVVVENVPNTSITESKTTESETTESKTTES